VASAEPGGHRIVDDLGAGGFGWQREERYVRTSHALAAGGRVWLVDPLDMPGLGDRVAALGEPAGIVQLLDRHSRDCAVLAARLGVPHHVVPDALPDVPFELVPVVRWPKWRESALWWPERRILVAADAIGTNPFMAGRERAGVHPVLRLLRPPRPLSRYEPEHLLVGHGEGVHGPEATAVLRRAVATARTGLPGWTVAVGAEILRGRIR
jgi:hypothetical protein